MDETNNAATTETNPPQPETQTFSKDYVDALRRESGNYRTRAQTAEKTVKAFRDAFGLRPDDEIGDISARLAARDAQALDKANTRLIAAEIKGLPGYETALLERLIDRSDIKVGDDGTVTGLKEAAEATAKQFAAVLKAASKEQWVPSNPAAGDPPAKDPNKMTYDEFAAYAAAGDKT